MRSLRLLTPAVNYQPVSTTPAAVFLPSRYFRENFRKKLNDAKGILEGQGKDVSRQNIEVKISMTLSASKVYSTVLQNTN
jgi:hypothetical protein